MQTSAVTQPITNKERPWWAHRGQRWKTSVTYNAQSSQRTEILHESSSAPETRACLGELTHWEPTQNTGQSWAHLWCTMLVLAEQQLTAKKMNRNQKTVGQPWLQHSQLCGLRQAAITRLSSSLHSWKERVFGWPQQYWCTIWEVPFFKVLAQERTWPLHASCVTGLAFKKMTLNGEKVAMFSFPRLMLFIYLFICLFIFGCVGSSLLCAGFL